MAAETGRSRAMPPAIRRSVERLTSLMPIDLANLLAFGFLRELGILGMGFALTSMTFFLQCPPPRSDPENLDDRLVFSCMMEFDFLIICE